MNDPYESLKLKNQLCFPLYAAAREVIRSYRGYLEELDLTYTQYIAMMVFWEKHLCSVKETGEMLRLDSGTLTPVLKSLEAKGLVKRFRSEADERVVMVEITPVGEALKEKAVTFPRERAECARLTQEEAETLYSLLYKVLGEEEK